jgi:hypothetical protein
MFVDHSPILVLTLTLQTQLDVSTDMDTIDTIQWNADVDTADMFQKFLDLILM